MQPPTEQEVKEYIHLKKGWPDKFCDHMAEKFWNFYESKGWLVGRVKMKSWQAAFNSQWQQLRKEDLEILEKFKNKPEIVVMNPESEISVLDDLLLQYRTNFEKVSNEQLLAWYEYLDKNKLRVMLTKQDVELIKAAYGDDRNKCRSAVVKMTFDFMVNNSYTFTELVNKRKQFK